MIERPADQRLEREPFQFDILGGVDAGLLGVAQRVRTGHAEADDQHIRPFRLDLLEQVAALIAAQIEEEQSRAILLEDGFEPIGLIDVANRGAVAEKSANPPNEIGILGVKNARGRGYHAAATSAWKRTSGRRM